ncbi:MAG: DUF4349 domain-containing protein [Oscillospiraceae bacterium]|nr:DUF4349 domain-containing protein [Oscillospiraceae bacterium]
MKRFWKATALALALCLMLTLMTACGGASDSATESAPMEDFNSSMTDGGFKNDSLAGGTLGGTMDVTDEEGTTDGGEGGSFINTNPTEKMIYTAEVYAQTLDYDAAIATLRASLAECGGYIESYNESNGGSYYSGSYYEGGGRRSASYTLRIPCEKFEGFLSGLSRDFNVIDQYLYSENVTLQYVDLESRINSLTAQQERLLELLAEAETLEQVLTIESQLTETRAEIESLTSSLRVLADRVRYSTITLNINETTTFTPGAKDSFAQRFLRSLGTSWDDLKDDTEDLVLFVGRNFLQLIIWAVVLFGAWKFLRSKKRPHFPKLRRNKKKNNEESDSEA